MQSRELPHEHLASTFAKHLADRLRMARASNRFHKLVIAAEPDFLGRLRAELDEPTKKLLAGEVQKPGLTGFIASAFARCVD